MNHPRKRHCAASSLNTFRAEHPEVDALYVPMLRDEDQTNKVAQRVKAIRVEAVTLYFHHRIFATVKALTDEAEGFQAVSGSIVKLYVQKDKELHVHVLYAALKLSELLALTWDDELEDLLAQRMLELVELYSPQDAWHDDTAKELLGKMHWVNVVVAQKITSLAAELTKTPARIARLEQWVEVLNALARAQQKGPYVY